MTEEREKELLDGLFGSEIYPYREDVEQLINTVADEAKREGVEAVREKLCLCGEVLPPCAVCEVAQQLLENKND